VDAAVWFAALELLSSQFPQEHMHSGIRFFTFFQERCRTGEDDNQLVPDRRASQLYPSTHIQITFVKQLTPADARKVRSDGQLVATAQCWRHATTTTTQVPALPHLQCLMMTCSGPTSACQPLKASFKQTSEGLCSTGATETPPSLQAID
jgi:hypothetical protein